MMTFFEFALQTFGEVRKIVRAADGDLHIEFRSADVADNVSVQIVGVAGSD